MANDRMTTADLAESRDRDLAARDDAALADYLSKWTVKVEKLQRAHAARWRVPGLSEEEVRDAMTLRLLEAVRSADAEAQPLTPGERGVLVLFQRHLTALRRRFRLDPIPLVVEDCPRLERPLDQEQRCLAIESATSQERAAARARDGLSRPQARWLAALTQAASSHEFFATSGRLNLSAAARLLGKHRSSALRALDELRTRFTSELDELD